MSNGAPETLQVTGAASGASLSHRRAHAKALNERIEIPVAIEQPQTFFDATRGDDRVDCFSRRDAETAQLAIVFCRTQGLAAEFYDRQRGQEFLGAVEIAVPRVSCAGGASRPLSFASTGRV
ncbi:hypothetical protein IYY11_22190 [Methylocystis sp. H62]|uniref:hypothetical protein n=1 Tax=Methylocystis sp. H62 TaxID=2785789 RepID=UPI0018C22DA2|nr:hypothetical protein [Methylocystis sp. H62]MBG0796074.1 hypothetical protein [Methylocystis sp. H62]